MCNLYYADVWIMPTIVQDLAWPALTARINSA